MSNTVFLVAKFNHRVTSYYTKKCIYIKVCIQCDTNIELIKFFNDFLRSMFYNKPFKMAEKRKFHLPSDDEDAEQGSNDFSAHTRFKNRVQSASKSGDVETTISLDEIIKDKNVVVEPQKSIVPRTVTAPKKTNCILVNPRQRGNPILKFVRNVPYEYSEITPDYIMGQNTCALFLSLRYHTLKPEYIHERLKQLGRQFELTVLLVQIDMKDPHHSVKELTKIAILADCTLILSWSPEEAGRYLEIYKAYENKPPDLIKERTEAAPVPKLVDAISSVKSVNRTNAMTLLHTFKSLHNIIGTKVEDLALCPGMGQNKASRLNTVVNQPFLKNVKPNVTE